MKNIHKRALLAGMCLISHILSAAPQGTKGLTMDDALRIAAEKSVMAMTFRNGYAADYWQYRSYRASFLPFLTLSADLGGLNRSMVILQDYHTGSLAYRTNWSLTNDIQLSLSQNVPLTGGTISLSANLSRLDQYEPDRSVTFFSQPLFISYSQSIGGFNSFKWSRRIMPEQHELSRREYVENMEKLKATVVSAYWNYVSMSDSYERCLEDYAESRRQFALAKRRYSTGRASRTSLQQLEFKLVDDSMTVASRYLDMQMAHDALCSHLGIDDGNELVLSPEFHVPELNLEYYDVMEKALANSSFNISAQIQLMQADENVSRAKAAAGFHSSVNLRVGLSGTDNSFKSSIDRLQDQEIVSVSVSLPVVDWGEGKAQLRMSKAQAGMVKSQQEQALADFRRELSLMVMEFNNLGTLCRLSGRAYELAVDNYSDALDEFSEGKLTVTELSQIRGTRDSARMSYIGNVSRFWQQYYQLRSITLWDYIDGQPVSCDFDLLEMNLLKD